MSIEVDDSNELLPVVAATPAATTPGAEPDATEPGDTESIAPGRSWTARLSESGPLRVALAIVAAFIVFAFLLVAKGADPVEAYRAMWDSVARDSNSFGDVLVRMTPYLLAALAVAVPARAGLFNLGGEGQILIGTISALGMANLLDGGLGRMATLVFMALASMVGAALWAGIAAILRQTTGTSETISTLLLNYLAALFLGWLVYGPWKDPGSAGFPRSRIFTDGETLPILFGRVHVGLVVAVGAAFVVWAVLKWTPWGFRLGVLGRNTEAARRAGFSTRFLAASALMLGGALAGLAGMLQVSGVEGQLHPSMLAGYGFIGVLASWMVRHHPLKAIASSALLAAIAIGGNGLKIRAGLSSASVNILMALLLLAVLGWGTRRKART